MIAVSRTDATSPPAGGTGAGGAAALTHSGISAPGGGSADTATDVDARWPLIGRKTPVVNRIHPAATAPRALLLPLLQKPPLLLGRRNAGPADDTEGSDPGRGAGRVVPLELRTRGKRGGREGALFGAAPRRSHSSGRGGTIGGGSGADFGAVIACMHRVRARHRCVATTGATVRRGASSRQRIVVTILVVGTSSGPHESPRTSETVAHLDRNRNLSCGQRLSACLAPIARKALCLDRFGRRPLPGLPCACLALLALLGEALALALDRSPRVPLGHLRFEVSPELLPGPLSSFDLAGAWLSPQPRSVLPEEGATGRRPNVPVAPPDILVDRVPARDGPVCGTGRRRPRAVALFLRQPTWH